MIRFLFRFVGLLLLALAFIFFIYDGTKSIADQRWYVTKVDEVWSTLHESSLTLVRPTLEGLAPWLWDAANYVLSTSFCLVLVILGTILVLIGRKRRALIGYARN